MVAVAACFVGEYVDDQGSRDQGDVATVRDTAGSAAKNCSDPSSEFAWRERLRDVVIGAEFQAGNSVVLFATRGEHHDGDRRDFTDPTKHFEPVDAGKHKVEYDEIWQVLESDAKAVVSVGTPR